MKRFSAKLFLLLILFFFFLQAAISLDPDFGWRLRAGQLYQSFGIPKKDPFTYTMPSFAWVDHAWLVSLGIGWLYPVIGKTGLALAFSLIALIALAIVIKGAGRSDFISKPFGKYWWWPGNFIFLLAVSSLMPFFGIRAQVVNWLFLSIFILLLRNRSLWKKWRFLIPLFFLLWSNFHGSFVAGILIFVFWTFLRSFRKKGVDKKDFLLIVVSIFATLVGPYGVGGWREVWSSVTDTKLRWQISEWMPAFFMMDFSIVAIITLSTLLIWRYRRKFHLEELVLFFGILFQAILSRRHIPLWLIVSIHPTIKSIYHLLSDIKKFPQGGARFKKVINYAWTGSLVLLVIQIIFSINNARLLTEGRFYPQKAVSFIRINPPTGKIFSEYGWGGYLIWKLPEKKVFVDGRMPSWRWDDNPPQETGTAFDDYLRIIEGEVDYESIFGKYKIDTVLWPAPKPLGLIGFLQSKLDEFLAKLGGERKKFDLLTTLAKDGWELVYQDSVAVVYRK